MPRFVIAVAVLLLVSACATQSPVIQVETSRYHRLTSPVVGRDVVILANADQSPGDEFATYADLIGQALENLGWRVVELPDQAAAVLRFRWAVDAPVVETVLTPSAIPPMGNMWGYRRSTWGADPFPYWQAQRVTHYPKWLSVTIVEANQPSAAPLFEGRVTSRRGGTAMAPIMPYLVRGMFDGFPGPNGAVEAKALEVQP
ncbi:DUF4136 domain-containing protein [Magnetospirillum gryphiswaldense]|uniref:Exported protein n=1 Tax=Magnetospirillum gryphiswaldense TaxID=55518 RepID=A4U223_9PROT|nr:hypothetical protein [Magnetospirillum gryphiswaldense]AVM74895.1 hypothetical protein MSR1_24140 [Magnetospirillum gryphiswaldense MSR-1]AVM78798.1 hypothetical protein MSR1L_24140 [Magnetospirillum gryphiswaldense]CAM76930.1 exported protein [Magnetospirillum gryphiswaldense MSR-1]